MPKLLRLSVLTTIASIGLAITLSAQDAAWRANPDVVARTTKRLPQFNFDEAGVKPYELPDPLERRTGRVRTTEEWKSRRAEILDLFRTHVYGRSPAKPKQLAFEIIEEKPSALGGAATLKRVAVKSTHEGREHRFELTMFLPNAVRGPVPMFLLLNNRAVALTDPTRAEKSGFWPAETLVARRYGIASLHVGELAPDDNAKFREGVIRLFEGTAEGPRPPDAWAGLAAWAWGASRALDYFETDRRVDAKRVALVGHSRGGKAALWAGAEDERFAMMVSNESGEGGAALSRRNFGETVARITESFPRWFAANYRTFAGREPSLPVDQHMLLALIAPRALYVTSADEDLWSDPRGEFLSLVHASPVYALWREPSFAADEMPPLDRPLVRGRRAYHVRSGVHDLTLFDWERFVDFADTVWRR